jgi:hypothetical protein
MKMQLFILLLFFSATLKAQTAVPKKDYYRFAVSTSHTAKPLGSFSALAYRDIHPGFEFTRGKILKNKNGHQWVAELTVGYLWHRWVQHNLALSVAGGYRRLLGDNWGAMAKIGTGYQLSMPTGKVYTITGDGVKERGHILRSQGIVTISLDVDKKINAKGVKAFIEYQQKIQAPFIKEYVPLLPYNTMLLGCKVPIR